jgi:3-isopropylmalate/(R)-2-methylmalate dehydratase small subunit
MQSFNSHTGLVVPLERENVDTDQIIPKQFLKRIERTGYGEFLFYDWRFQSDGKPNPGFILNAQEYAGATVLVAGRNFGCGSSREHGAFELTVNLESCTVSSADGFSAQFAIDPFTRTSLRLDLDEIGMTLQHEAEISEYEKSHC